VVNTLIALNGAWSGAILHERNNHSPRSRAARDVVVSMRGQGSKFGRKLDAAVDALLTQRNTEGAAKAGAIAMTTCWAG
jgi:hypothetical protein